MKLYRKKMPILAQQWFPGVSIEGVAETKLPTGQVIGLLMTNEGGQIVQAGYWVAKNPGGEMYCIAPHVFAQTYEPVPEG